MCIFALVRAPGELNPSHPRTQHHITVHCAPASAANAGAALPIRNGPPRIKSEINNKNTFHGIRLCIIGGAGLFVRKTTGHERDRCDLATTRRFYDISQCSVLVVVHGVRNLHIVCAICSCPMCHVAAAAAIATSGVHANDSIGHGMHLRASETHIHCVVPYVPRIRHLHARNYLRTCAYVRASLRGSLAVPRHTESNCPSDARAHAFACEISLKRARGKPNY